MTTNNDAVTLYKYKHDTHQIRWAIAGDRVFVCFWGTDWEPSAHAAEQIRQSNDFAQFSPADQAAFLAAHPLPNNPPDSQPSSSLASSEGRAGVRGGSSPAPVNVTPAAKHTPGPWYTQESRNGHDIDIHGDRYEDTDGASDVWLAVVKGNATSEAVTKANAALIVHAVNCHADLLAACEAALESCTLFNVCGQLKSAIAKAKSIGGSNV